MKGPVSGVIFNPIGFENRTYGTFVVRSYFFEAGEVSGAQEHIRGPVHRLEVQLRIATVVGVLLGEGILFSMDMVGVFPSGGAEAGVKTFVHLFY